MKALRRIATLLALLSAGMSALLLIRLKAPRGFMLWIPRLVAGALEPFAGLMGVLSALAGAISGSWLALVAGAFGARTAWKYLTGTVIQPQMEMFPRFDRAFGPDWESRISTDASLQHKDALLPARWNWLAKKDPEPRWLRDVPFWPDADTGRTLLCDLWLPAEPIPQTGLGIVYFHGSAWYLGDKDFGTREFFRHLAAQGHLVMDAQYRLSPETDISGMIADVKRAIAWLKGNAQTYGVDPQRVVVSGASAGGQLAELAAYAPQHPDLTPPELRDLDLSVRAVAAYYGPCDLSACYCHTNQQVTPLSKAQAAPENGSSGRRMARLMTLFTGNASQGEEMAQKYANMAMAGRLEPVLGGSPEEVPERYRLFSPITHAGPGSPPTFLVQGADDLIVPFEATCRLYDQLLAAGVPVVNLILPHVDHGFDLMLPRVSPPAQSALYELDRFLALM